MKNNNNINWKVITEENAKWARWIALYEAVNIIMDKAEERGLSHEDVIFKPLDIRDYISSTEDIILRKILNDEHNIKIEYKEESSNKTEDYQFI